MNWEGFVQWLTNISNNPVFISVVSILSGLLSVLVIISKTSVGRKALKQLTALGRDTQFKVGEIAGKVDGKLKAIDSKLIELKNEKEQFMKDAETKAKIFYNMFDFYETQMIESLRLIPNVKLQKQLDKIELEWKDKKQEIEKYVGITYAEMQDKFSDLEKQIEELKNGRVNDNTTESKEI